MQADIPSASGLSVNISSASANPPRCNSITTPQINFMISHSTIPHLANSFASLGIEGNNPWILDGGATDYVTSSLSWFTTHSCRQFVCALA